MPRFPRDASPESSPGPRRAPGVDAASRVQREDALGVKDGTEAASGQTRARSRLAHELFQSVWTVPSLLGRRRPCLKDTCLCPP